MALPEFQMDGAPAAAPKLPEFQIGNSGSSNALPEFNFSAPAAPALPELDMTEPADIGMTEWAAKQWDRVQRAGEMFGENFLGVFRDAIPALVSDFADSKLSIDREMLKESLGKPFAEIPKGPIETAVGEWRKASFANLQEAQKRQQEIGATGPQGLWDDVLNSSAGSVGRMMGHFALGGATVLATRNPLSMLTAPSLLALYADSSVSEQAKLEGEGVERESAKNWGKVYGAIDALTELPGFAAAGKLVDDVLFKAPGAMKQFAKFMAFDWTGEQAATVLQSLTEKGALDKPWRQWQEELKRDLPVSMLAPFVTAGAQVGGMKLTSKGVDSIIQGINSYHESKLKKQSAPFVEFPEEYVKARDRLFQIGEELKVAIAERDAADAAMEERIKIEQAANPGVLYGDSVTLPGVNLSAGELQTAKMQRREPMRMTVPPQQYMEKEFRTYTLTEDPEGNQIKENLLDMWNNGKVKPGVYVADTTGLRKSLEQTAQLRIPVPLSETSKQTAFEHERKLDTRSLSRKAKIQLHYLDLATEKVKEWQRLYMPDSTIVLSFDHPSTEPAVRSSYGTNWFQKADTGAQEVSLLNLNSNIIFEDGGQSISYPTKAGNWARETVGVKNLTKAASFETAAHEFSHAMTFHYFVNKLPTPAKTALQRAYIADVLKGAQAAESASPGYLNAAEGSFIPGAGKIHAKEAARIAMPRPAAEYGRYNSPRKERKANYSSRLTFVEWLAHQGSRVLSQKEARTPAEKIVSPIVKALQHFYRKNREVWKPNLTFKAFMDQVFASNRVKALEDQQLSAALAHFRALKEMKANPPEAVIVDRMGKIAAGGKGKIPGVRWLPRGMQREIPQAVDKFNWFMKWTAGLLQIGDYNPWIPGLKYSNQEGGEGYIPAVQRMQDVANAWKGKAQDIAKELISVTFKGGKREAFNAFMVEADAISDSEGRALTLDEKEALRVKHGLREIDLAVAEKMWGFFREAITKVEEIRKGQLVSALAEGKITQEYYDAELQKILRDFEAMRNRNYLPHTRFGKYAIHVTALRKDVKVNDFYTAKKIGDTVAFETYENERDWHKAMSEIENGKYGAYKGDVIAKANRIEETEPGVSLLGFDQRLARVLLDGLQLEPEERARANELLLKLNPTEGFRKKLIERKNIPGYSDHVTRVWADYGNRFANFIARLETIDSMNKAIDEIEDSYKNPVNRLSLRAQGKRSEILNWVKEHQRYLMNPTNELAGLRALGFMYYLGAVPKAAIVNLSQVPMVAYPYLAALYGDTAAVKQISKAMKDIVAHYSQKGALTQAERDMYGSLGGLLDESFASMLGALQEGSILQKLTKGRILGDERTALLIQQAQEMAGFLFSYSEQLNRRVVALSAYRLSMGKYNDHARAVAAARQAVEKTQFEYARYNRPKLMRGKKSAFFLFQQYAMSMLYFLGKPGEGRARYLLLALLLAGIQGVPFAENAIDLADFLATKWKEALGYTNPKVQLRADLRKFIEGLAEQNPWLPQDSDVYMKGLASQVPIPGTGAKVNLSGSISFGRPIPGTDVLNRTNMSPLEKVGKAGGEAAGPLAAIPINMLMALGSDDPWTMKAWERAMPTAAANLSKASRWVEDRQEVDAQGDPLVPFDLDNPAHVAEIAMQGLGFQPARVAEARERQWLVKEKIDYYAAAKTAVMAKAWRTFKEQERSVAMPEIREMVRNFNERVPHPSMRIDSKGLETSFKQKLTRSRLKELGYGPEKKYADYYEEEMIKLGGPSSEEVRNAR